jgi:DNA-binding MarR family transcriptional regulator
MSAAPPSLQNPLEALIGYQLRRASAELMAELARDLGALGLRPAEASVLLLVAANPGATQSDVGRLLDIQRANMSPLVGALEKRGLIRRERVNGRSHGLAVTEEGAALCRDARRSMDEHDARLLAYLPQAERAGFEAALATLRRALPKSGPETV